MTKLFIGGFPLDIKELELVQLVAPYGTVSTIKIVRDKKTNQCKGYAFIEMLETDGAENAVAALNGAEMQGRELKLNIVADEPPVKAYVRLSKPGDPQRKKRPRRPLS
ncbi:RNA recognition motif. (a.k.a. RRM, RBD, or RNP domain) [Mucilaginibacter mallensis]|uniref:RNA recognition motif. (A.k.a. RRM, RBD, or RNP domain) n=1 Tax=Mucilaginibacter mallensis TaxID=652787 RepID=A0A1H1XWA7_MUCMA|nr:RNA-binding protein [Mucilaginibacter mallensis]SDT13494.1 RNA recognition motif. (a.k.a. RRM, RBD, or RNP domain) [Mucilaginibacter mallensis]